MTKKGNTAMVKIKLLTVAILSIYGVLSLSQVYAQNLATQNNGGATGVPATGAPGVNTIINASQIPGGMPNVQPAIPSSGISTTTLPMNPAAMNQAAMNPAAMVPAAMNPAASLSSLPTSPTGQLSNGQPSPQINYGMPVQQAQPQQVYVTSPQGMPQGIPMEIPAVDPRDPSAAVLNMLNTTNERIREINRKIYDKARVINEPPVPQPEAVISTATANLSPGSMPPVVRLFKNRSTSIVMTDNTGAAWPIVNYEIGSSEDFTVRRMDKPAPEGSVLTVTPNGSHVSTNIILFLKDLPTPVVLELVSAQKKVDYRIDIRVQAKGPNSQLVAAGLPDQIDTRLLAVLSGIAPTGAKDLKTTTGAVQAWLTKDGKMFVRTRYRVMSPAFEQVTSSPDGTYAYKMQAVPVVLYKYGDHMGEIGIDVF